MPACSRRWIQHQLVTTDQPKLSAYLCKSIHSRGAWPLPTGGALWQLHCLWSLLVLLSTLQMLSKQGQPAAQVAGLDTLQTLVLSSFSGLAAQMELSRLTQLHVRLASTTAMHVARQHLDLLQ